MSRLTLHISIKSGAPLIRAGGTPFGVDVVIIQPGFDSRDKLCKVREYPFFCSVLSTFEVVGSTLAVEIVLYSCFDEYPMYLVTDEIAHVRMREEGETKTA